MLDSIFTSFFSVSHKIEQYNTKQPVIYSENQSNKNI